MIKHTNQNDNLDNILFDVIMMNDVNYALKMLTMIHLLYKYKYLIGHYPLFRIDTHIYVTFQRWFCSCLQVCVVMILSFNMF